MPLTLALAAGLAAAAPAATGVTVGHFHPQDVARASARYAQAEAVAATAFGERREQAAAFAEALVRYEEALDLLGAAAPAAERAALTQLDRAFRRQQAVVQEFAQRQLEAFDVAFSAALTRALRGRPATECQASQPRGLRLGPAPSRESVTCEGPSLNAELATRMDADPALAADVAALTAAAWPSFDLPRTAAATVGEGVRLDVHDVMHRHLGARLREIEAADQGDREEFAAALESGASASELARLTEAARAVTARTAAARAEAAAPVLGAYASAAEKLARKGFPGVAWCARPETLGGCRGTPPTAEQREALAAAPTVKKLPVGD